MVKGSITVFFAALFGVCITLVMALTESGRLIGLETRFESAAEAAVHSLFSMYDGDLLDEFDIMLLNPADLADQGGAEGVLCKYLEKSFSTRGDHFYLYGDLFRGHVISCTITDMVRIVDDRGEFFAREILEYMKYRSVRIAVEKAEELLRQQDEGESARKEMEERLREERQSADESISGEDQAETREEYEKTISESWLSKLEAIRRNGWLELILPFEEAASEYEIEPCSLPSDGDMLTMKHPVISPWDVEESLLFTEYLLEHCSCFVYQKPCRKMCYELEYILNGNASDKENLKETIEQLMLIREGMNIAAIVKEPSLRNQAEAAARALMSWTGQESVIRLTQMTIITGWAFAESIVDLRTLLSGKNVPMLKERKDWVLAYGDIGSVLDGDKKLIGGERGLSYMGYLRLLLYTQNDIIRRYRTMDVIQLRLGTYKPDFSLGNCLYAVQADMEISQTPLFFSFGRRQYAVMNTQSRMY